MKQDGFDFPHDRFVYAYKGHEIQKHNVTSLYAIK